MDKTQTQVLFAILHEIRTLIDDQMPDTDSDIRRLVSAAECVLSGLSIKDEK